MDSGVVIFDGNSRLTLTCLGGPEQGYPATAYKTRIEITSGLCSTSVEAFGWDYGNFLEGLIKLHNTMTGEVCLKFWNEAHSIAFAGGGKGSIEVIVDIRDSSPFGARLTVPMHFDQSYLPDIIAAVDSNFPAR
jgi:hypothetical protein